MSASPRFALVGAGAVASALASSWVRSGARLVGVASRGGASARALAERCGVPRAAVGDLASLPLEVELLLVAVPDARIVEVVRALRVRCEPRPPFALAAHTSGALPAALLAELGAPCVSLHPLYAFAPPPNAAPEFAEVGFALEGEDGAVALATPWVERLGGQAFPLTAAAKPLYHAAAVLASNDLVAVLDRARRCWDAAVGPGADPRALRTLAVSALRALGEKGDDAAAALSGPVVRGDREVVRAHLAALAELSAAEGKEELSTQRLYLVLARAALDLARRAGRAEPAALDALAAELSAADRAPEV